jgi:hypothetical protein
MNQEIKLKNPQLEVGDYFDIGWKIFKDNISSFLILALVIDLPLAILELFAFVPGYENTEVTAETSRFILAFTILNMISSVFGFVCCFIITELAVFNRPIEIVSVIKQGLSRLAPSLFVFIVMVILMLIGLLLFILPGIYIAYLLHFSLNAVALRGRGLDALSYSRDLVKGQWWKILWRSLSISLVFGIISLVLLVFFGFGTIVLSVIPLGAEFVSVVESVVIGLLSYLFYVVTTTFFLNVDYVRHQN